MLSLPLLGALLALLPWPKQIRHRVDIVGMIVASAGVILAAASVGLLFLPTPAALFLAADSARENPRSLG